jgi:hypothetical protein
VWDVFEPDGSYLGAVKVPDRTTLTAMTRDHVWGIQLGSSDEEYVVRLKLMVPTN